MLWLRTERSRVNIMCARENVAKVAKGLSGASVKFAINMTQSKEHSLLAAILKKKRMKNL